MHYCTQARKPSKMILLNGVPNISSRYFNTCWNQTNNFINSISWYITVKPGVEHITRWIYFLGHWKILGIRKTSSFWRTGFPSQTFSSRDKIGKNVDYADPWLAKNVFPFLYSSSIVVGMLSKVLRYTTSANNPQSVEIKYGCFNLWCKNRRIDQLHFFIFLKVWLYIYI